MRKGRRWNMDKKYLKPMRVKEKLVRGMALALAVMMVLTSGDITVFAMNEENNEIISEIFALEEAVLTQEITVGDTVESIVFPESLDVVIRKEVETEAATEEVTEVETEEDTEVATEEPTEEPTEVGTEEVVEETTEEVVDVVPVEAPVTETAPVAETEQPQYEEYLLSVPVNWELNVEKSSKEAFSSETAGDSFVYTAVLEGSYTLLDGVTMPEITVVIVEAETETESETESESEELQIEFAFEESVNVNGIIITVSAEAGVLPEGTTLSITQITEEAELVELSQAADKADGLDAKSEEDAIQDIQEGFYAFDIKLLDKDGVEVQPDESKGMVKVTFSNPNPESFDASELEVYHVDEASGEAENLHAEATDSQEVEVQADSFSPYILRVTDDTIILYTLGASISEDNWEQVNVAKYRSYDTIASLPTPVMADKTLTFDGWYSDEDYKNRETRPTPGKTYYAKWKRSKQKASSSYMCYEYNRSYARVDARGIKDGDEIKSTYSNAGFQTFTTYGTSKPSGKGSYLTSNSNDIYSCVRTADYSNTDVYVAVTATFEEPFVRYNYYIWNKGDSPVTGFNLGVAADVMIGKNDRASLSLGTEDGNSYVIMKDGNGSELRLYYAGDAVSSVNSLWTGKYSDREKNIYTDSRKEQSKIDSAVAFSWKNITIPANDVVHYSVLLGCGQEGSLKIVRKFGYDKNGDGTVTEDEIKDLDKNDVVYAPAAVEKDGYIFTGWNTRKNGTGKAYQPGNVVSLETDVSLYAQYKAIENTAEITITLDDVGWDGQNVELYQNGVKKYTLADQGNGLYKNDQVINGTYDIYVNGRKSDKTLVVACIDTSILVTQSVTYKLLHITTLLDDEESSAPGVVTLRSGSTVVYTSAGEDGVYTEYILTSENNYDIYVDGADTLADIGVTIPEQTVKFHTISVRIHDDAPWTDTSVVLRDGNDNEVAVLASTTPVENTVAYEKIMQENLVGSYSVWIDELDCHEVLWAKTGYTDVDVYFYTATMRISGSLMEATITMTNGVEEKTFELISGEGEERVYKSKHVLINTTDNETEKSYKLSVKEDVDKEIIEVNSTDKEHARTYWKIDYYRCFTDKEPEIRRNVYVKDGYFAPTYPSLVTLNGYTFDFWSETSWKAESETINVAFDHATPIHEDVVLYANYAVPTVTIGELINTDANGIVNASGSYYRMANLTISGFEKGDAAIKYIFLTTEYTESIKILDGTVATLQILY